MSFKLTFSKLPLTIGPCSQNHVSESVIFVMQWLNEERLVQRLVEMIDPSQTTEVLFLPLCIITIVEPEPVMVLLTF